LNKELVVEYLNLSQATAKSHMKQPKKGIRSTTPKHPKPMPTHVASVPVPNQILPLFNKVRLYPGPTYNATRIANVLPDDKSIANMFCFGDLAEKIIDFINNNLTGNFPFMSLDGSICFVVMYHYKINSILTTPIANLDDKSIFEAYKTNFKLLEVKGLKPKLNVIDNQATKHITQFLTKKECKLQLVEPPNHWVNAAE
jgi:hypothetical protein